MIIHNYECDVYQIHTPEGVVDQTHFGLFEVGRSARNWIAVVRADRHTPGGLERKFLDKIRVPLLVSTQVQAGDFLEVGADRIDKGVRSIQRSYFRVLVVQPDFWIVRTSVNPKGQSATILPLEIELEILARAVPQG